jgi:DNA-directed RNA polymerase specialized sigma24 family protein
LSRAAALLVLVDGLTQADAARLTGLSPSGVGKVVARMRRGLELARQAV